MKYFQLLQVSFILLLFSSCSDSKKPSEMSSTKAIDSISIPIDSVKTITEPEKTLHPSEYLYVSATSGLNYRETPKGEVLGKFQLNDYVGLVERTEIKETISDNGKEIQGEWVGVLHENKMVYVFDAFLSETPSFSDMELYYAYSPTRQSGDKTNTFINLSQAPYVNGQKTGIYPEYTPLIPEEKLGPETIKLSNSLKQKFLKSTNFSNSDMVFVYASQSDTVFTFKLSDMKFMALLDGYFSGENGAGEASYELGITINHKACGIINSEENLVYIGKHNPFNTNSYHSINWTEYHPKTESENYQLDYTQDGFHYIISKRSKEAMAYTLQVFDTTNGEIVQEQLVSGSEGISPAPLTELRTGKLFKGKPPVISGLRYHSFSCRSIFFLDKTEPPINILCDCRH